MSIQIIPFSEDLLPQAGELLAQRHTCDRASFPILPERFEDPSSAQSAVATSFRRENASGFAALDQGHLVAYLIGEKIIDNLWGRSAWVRPPGCAYDPGTGAEIIRDLYAALGAHWVEYGIFTHFAQIPIGDPALVQAWFSLSFGVEQIHALADLNAMKPAFPQIPSGLEIVKAEPDDRHDVADMSDVIWRTQVRAPVWGVMMPESIRETAAGWAGLVDEADVTVWLARQNRHVVGIQGYWPAEAAQNDLHITERCLHLSVAGTRAEARGQGINTLLTQHGLAHAYANSYSTCETDWRSTNLLSSRFWPRQGFQPVLYRLARRIDPRIAWANGSL
jgi:GNAT superfamily N-acetyltransferase